MQLTSGTFFQTNQLLPDSINNESQRNRTRTCFSSNTCLKIMGKLCQAIWPWISASATFGSDSEALYKTQEVYLKIAATRWSQSVKLFHLLSTFHANPTRKLHVAVRAQQKGQQHSEWPSLAILLSASSFFIYFGSHHCQGHWSSGF